MDRKLPKWFGRLNEVLSMDRSPMRRRRSPLVQAVERVSAAVSDERANGYAAVWNLVNDAPEGTNFALIWRAVQAYADAAEAYRERGAEVTPWWEDGRGHG